MGRETQSGDDTVKKNEIAFIVGILQHTHTFLVSIKATTYATYVSDLIAATRAQPASLEDNDIHFGGLHG